MWYKEAPNSKWQSAKMFVFARVSDSGLRIVIQTRQMHSYIKDGQYEAFALHWIDISIDLGY
jgi:hypothetical protein